MAKISEEERRDIKMWGIATVLGVPWIKTKEGALVFDRSGTLAAMENMVMQQKITHYPTAPHTTGLKLTARIEAETLQHAKIGVFQNGGKAGVLCVEANFAEQIIDQITTK